MIAMVLELKKMIKFNQIIQGFGKWPKMNKQEKLKIEVMGIKSVNSLFCKTGKENAYREVQGESVAICQIQRENTFEILNKFGVIQDGKEEIIIKRTLANDSSDPLDQRITVGWEVKAKII